MYHFSTCVVWNSRGCHIVMWMVCYVLRTRLIIIMMLLSCINLMCIFSVVCVWFASSSFSKFYNYPWFNFCNWFIMSPYCQWLNGFYGGFCHNLGMLKSAFHLGRKWWLGLGLTQSYGKNLIIVPFFWCMLLISMVSSSWILIKVYGSTHLCCQKGVLIC